MWLIYSQISALSEALTNVLAKHSMKKYDSVVVTWFWVTSSLLLLGGLVLFNGIPEIKPLFYTILIARILLDTVALLLYTKALQLEDISLVAPLFNFSAIFTLSASFLINKELPSSVGIIGIVLIVLGAYMLNFERGNRDLLHPFKTILTNRGSRYMVISTALYGVIFSISKVGIESSSLVFYTFASALGLSVTIFPIALWKNKSDVIKILKPKNAFRILPIGLLDGVKILALMATIKTSFVSFADASNNTSVIYGSILGGIFLQEKIRGRMLPILLMCGGVILLVLS